MHRSDTNDFGHEKEQKNEQKMNKKPRTQRIRELNDQFRRTGRGGRQFITPGIQEMGLVAVMAIRQLVANYDAFCEDNDPMASTTLGT